MTTDVPMNSMVNESDVSIHETPNISGLVLVCGDSPVAGAVADMQMENAAWRVQTIAGLCSGTNVMGDVVSVETDRLVVALCQQNYSKTEVLSRSRHAGIETFGTQIIEIPADGDGQTNKAQSVTAVRSAIARAEALPNVKPENVKTSFSGSGEKISRRALFTIPPIEYRPVPTIDRSVCIAGSGCIQCEKSCPHSALKNVAGAVEVDSSVCSSCGICVAACPQRAVEFPGYSPSEIENQVEAVLTVQDDTAKDIVFACSKSEELPSGDWQFVPVACAAMVPSSALLAAVAAGARSVGILRCVEECVQRSRESVSGRIDYAQNILGRAGLNPNRILDFPPSASGQIMDMPTMSNPIQKDPVSIEIFGRTAASNSILALNERTHVPIEPFVHPYSPIAIPIIDSSTCTMCGTCSAVCPTGALTHVNSDERVELTLDAAKCMSCNECVAGCPEVSNGAIELELRTDVVALTIGPVILNSDQTVSCDTCSAVFTSARTLSKLESLLGEDYTYEAYGALCPECRTLN